MIEILGCRLDDVDLAEATRRILGFAKEGRGAQVVTLGTEMVVAAQHDTAFRAIVNASALVVCDTVGLLKAARSRGAHLRERVTGVELCEALCAEAQAEGLSLYFLGAAPGVADQAAQRLRERFAHLQIVGTQDGYFAPESAPQIAAAIAASGAAILFVGLGSPRQERWIAQYLPATRCGVGIGVGGSFDVLSGRVERAPQIWRRLGLEWCYRLVTQPHRWRRQLALPHFVWLITCERFFGRRPQRKRSA